MVEMRRLLIHAFTSTRGRSSQTRKTTKTAEIRMLKGNLVVLKFGQCYHSTE